MAAVATLFNNSQPAAFSFMVFVLLAAPCVAAIAATKRELGTWKLTFVTVLMQTTIAYLLSFLIFQTATLWKTSNSFKIGTIISLFILCVIIVLSYLIKNRKNSVCLGCQNQDCGSGLSKKK